MKIKQELGGVLAALMLACGAYLVGAHGSGETAPVTHPARTVQMDDGTQWDTVAHIHCSSPTHCQVGYVPNIPPSNPDANTPVMAYFISNPRETALNQAMNDIAAMQDYFNVWVDFN